MSIGQTTIKVSTIIEHAIRRAGVPAEAQSPEIISTARNNLYFILTNAANRTINYWCLDTQYLTLTENQSRYSLPVGTIDIKESNYRSITESDGTDSSDTDYYTRQFDESTKTKMIRLDSSTSGNILISYSTDGVSYTTHSTISHDGTDKWYNLDPYIEDVYLKLSVASGTLTVTDLTTVSAYSDLPMFRMNRYQYMTLPDKTSLGNPLQYWIDKQIPPEMVLWNIPNSTAANNCIHFVRHHEIDDIPTLASELIIPARWYEATIWNLAKNLTLELPNIPPERVKICAEMASSTTFEAELEEQDNSFVSFGPNIGVYTE